MRVPLEWLHEYCQPHMDVHTLAQRLALTGTEVERVEHHGVLAVENFVVGHVLERKKHPDADRLNVCMVDVGGSTPSEIVCGAPNVAAGQTVAVARPGAVMPDGTKLKKAKLRGIESQGMILSERELRISEDHDGIMILEDGVAPGTPLADVVHISTDVLVLEITPNRPDCLGIYGVAREVAATTGAQLKPAPWEQDPGSFGELEGIEITNEAGDELCPRFTARIFDGIQVGTSPLWMKARLMACGQRPISNVVDITNYVMLLTGQPMHAFDYDRVAGHRLNVRRARSAEQITTLDDQVRTLDEDIVLIEDAEGPTSIAGVMGGSRSEVSDATTTVVSEVATWNGPNIHATGLKLSLRSEASSRYEKQLQPEQTLRAQAVATRLFIDVCGATVRPGTLDLGGPGPEPVTIRLRDARIEGLLGVAIPRERSRQLLKAIGFTAVDAADGLDVTVPDFRRGDITREADLIEEVSRLDGVENLPATLPARHEAVGRLTPVQRLRRRAEDALAAQGLHEIVGWSFAGPELARKLHLIETGSPLTLANPMSSEQSQLRTTLLGSLLDVAARNRARGATAISLFESGAVYRSKALNAENLAEEPHHLGALLAGPVRPATWRDARPPQADFFAAKGVIAGLFEALGVDWDVRPMTTGSFLHPGRAAAVLVGGNHVGWVGEIHPNVAAAWEFEDPLAGFEIELSAIDPPAPTLFRDLVSFPEVREDLAVLVGDKVSAAEILAVIRRAGSPLLAGAEVFDVYRDPERLGADKVSVAVRLAYRADDRTLTDSEVARQRQFIVNALSQELEGTIRAGD
ncbi:MAG TPA: phenylalanine--tRNA ligase subunit beta [Solirubrobacteraceae bacterium]|jgi:phenylalanyl-tRNA synthetase beta chain|nr:phenylalanine--tRNA ligase subunit beta [Solirubrobacteraceae bacterium]